MLQLNEKSKMEEKNVKEFCINCSIPFSPSNPWEEEREKVYEISYTPSSSSSSQSKDILGSNKIINFDSPLPVSIEKRVTVHKVLGSTLKFEFIKILSSSSSSSDEEGKQKDDYDEENLPLCLNCAQILTNLYKFHNEFHQRVALDSYVDKKINKLKDVIHHQHHPQHQEPEPPQQPHQDDIINYDLHTPGPVSTTIDKNSLTTTTTKSSSSSIDNETQTPPVTAIVFLGEPKIVVDRVTGKKSMENNNGRPRKRPRKSTSQVKYVEAVISDSDSVDDTDCRDESDSFACRTYYVDDEDEDDDEDQPINYLDIDIKVEDQEWTEPQIPETSKVAKKVKSKPKKTTRKPRKPPTERKTREEKVPGEKRMRRKLSPSEKKSRKKKKGKSKEFDLRDYLSKRAKYLAPCWYCKSMDFATPSDCFDHTTKEHLPNFQVKSPGASVCDRCSKICSNTLTMGLHRKRCDLIPTGVIVPKAFICEVESCGKSFASKKNLKTHMAVHSEDRPFGCDQPECNYRAKTLSALSTHKVYQHPACGSVDLLKVQCDECGTWVKNNNSLKSHKFNMHTPEGFKKYNESKQLISARKKEETKEKKATASTFCLECKVDLFTPYGLTMHRKQFHPHELGNSYQCEVCGQSFMSASSLKTHRKVHSDERPFICDQCGRGFKFNHHLKDHAVQVHTEEGRLKYNERIRAKTRRRKLIARQLASGGVPAPHPPTTTTTTATTTIVKAAAAASVTGQTPITSVPGAPWDMTFDQLHHGHGPPKF